jgi:hypothetical protein
MLPRPLPKASAVWLGIIGGASLLDWYCDQGEPDFDTCSEQIRRLFRVHTPAGKVAFTAALAGGATWLHSHILREIV